MARTMSPYKIDAIIQWQNETEQREKALRDLEQLPGEPDEAYNERIMAMPQPRTWLEFAIDPLEDGSPKDPNSESPGMLDPRDPKNADSLLLDPSWAQATVGEDLETVYFYREAQKGRESLADSIKESLYPSIVQKTAAADYVPSLWNIFQNADGTKYEGHEVDGLWKRAGFHAVGGLWNLLFGVAAITLGSIAWRKAIPNFFAGTADIADETAEAVFMD